MCPIDAVIPLRTLLPRLLRNTIRRSIRNAGKIEFRRGREWTCDVDEIVEAVTSPVQQRRTQHPRPRGLKRLEIIHQVLPLRRSTDRLGGEKAGRAGGVQALDRIVQAQNVFPGNLPVAAHGSHRIGHRLGGKTVGDGPRRRIARSHQNPSQFVAVFECAKEPGFIFHQRAAQSTRILLPAERRSLAIRGRRIKRRIYCLQTLVALVNRSRAMQPIRSRLGHYIYDRRSRAS